MDPGDATPQSDNAQLHAAIAEFAADDAALEDRLRRREREKPEWDRLFSRPLERMKGRGVDTQGSQRNVSEPPAGSIKERLAWETRFGRLVPVVGPAVSSRGITGVTDKQREAREDMGKRRMALLRLLWESEEYWSPRIVGDVFDQHVMMWPQACDILLGLRDEEHGDVPNPPPPDKPPDKLAGLMEKVDQSFTEPSEAALVRLQLHLARLLASATRIWASGLRKNPAALGVQYPDKVVRIDRLSVWNPDEIDVFWTALEDALAASRILAENSGWCSDDPLSFVEAEGRPSPLPHNRPYRPNLGAVLLSPEMYLALLLFMTEMGADQVRFRRHYTTCQLAMNRGLHGRVRVETDAVGIRERHLRWQAALLHHTLLAPTQAHRGRRELAFVVSLAKLRAETSSENTPVSLDVPDLPHAAACDPWPPDEQEMFGSPAAVVRDVLMFTTYGQDGAMREPSRAASAIATLSRWALMHVADSASQKPGGLIFVTALDLEIELSLAARGPHSVLIPVWVGDKREGGVARAKPEWVLGRWAESGAAKYDPHRPREWKWLDGFRPSKDELWGYESGPLVVKLHGSPLHGLPESDHRVVSHRLTLGELDVLSMLLSDPVPKKVWAPREVGADQDKENPKTLFFLGHDVSSWDGRATWLRLANPAAPNTETTARHGGVDRDPEFEFAFLNMQATPAIRESTSKYSFTDLAAILGQVG